MIVGSLILLSVLAQRLVGRRVPFADRAAHNEAAGFIIAVVGVIYAVLLALVVIGVWERYEAADAIVAREADALGDVHRIAGAFPAASRDPMRAGLQAYGRAVIDEEWSLLGRGGSSPRADEALERVWTAFIGLEPASAREAALYQEGAMQLNRLGDARRDRLLAARSRLPLVLWSALLAGAFVTIGFSFLFGMKSTGFHMVMTGALAATIGLALFVILVMNAPYSGDVGVAPEAFEGVLQSFEARGGAGD